MGFEATHLNLEKDKVKLLKGGNPYPTIVEYKGVKYEKWQLLNQGQVKLPKYHLADFINKMSPENLMFYQVQAHNNLLACLDNNFESPHAQYYQKILK